MKSLVMGLVIALWSQFLWAYIPPAQMILQRTAENNGSGSYTVEQEVQIPTSTDPIVIKETWFVQNSNTMKLVAVGTGELKDKIKLTIVYSNGQKAWLEGNQKKQAAITDDFFETIHYQRSAEEMTGHLTRFGIMGLDDVRLSRSGGVVDYALGLPSVGEKLNPGVWIEQDQFLIRKLRLASGAEWTGESFSTFARGLTFPMKSQIRFGHQTVQIFVHSVSSKMAANFSKYEPNSDLALYPQAQDFYAQFR